MLKFTAIGCIISMALSSISSAYSMPDACENDKTKDFQKLIEEGEIGSKFIPKDIEITKISGSYVNKIPTVIYYWPVADKKYVTFGIRCGISCDYKILPICEVSASGVEWIAFRAKDKIILYAKYEDFVRK